MAFGWRVCSFFLSEVILGLVAVSLIPPLVAGAAEAGARFSTSDIVGAGYLQQWKEDNFRS